MRLTILERLARSLDEALRRLRRPRPAASAPCGGPCGCELIGDLDPDDWSGWVDLGDGIEARLLTVAEARGLGLTL